MPAHSSGPASARSMDSGMLKTKSSSTTTNFEYPPCVIDPSRSFEPYTCVFPFSQNCSKPPRHSEQRLHEFTIVPTPTRAPVLNLLTLDPTATTSPASSWPVIKGYGTFPQSPRMVWMSEWQMPQ